ncbi:MAG: virulence protein E [Bacteroidaceae bacterium]|nr:virulence protein E [Bacteroidaceae bacterium]
MNELQLFNGYMECHPNRMTMEQVVEIIRNDEKLCYRTRQHRIALKQNGDPKASTSLKSASPCIAVAVRFDGGKRREHIVGWTGLSLVDIDHVEEGDIPALMEKVRSDVHTLLAYVTISGRGVRILYRWILPEGETMNEERPTDKANMMRYEAAFKAGNDHYSLLLGAETDRQCKNPTRLCGLAHDPDAYYNPDATPFEVSLPQTKKRKSIEKVPLTRALPVVKAELEEAGIAYKPGHHNEYISRMGYLMNLYGVELEALTEWAVEEFSDYAGDVPAILRSCYTHTDEFHTRRLPRKKLRTGDDEDDRPTYPTMAEMEQYLREQAEFRYNVITGKGEWRMVGADLPFSPIDNRFIHTLWKGLATRFKIVRVQDVHQLLMSEFASAFNPFELYFSSLPAWDGVTDYIGQVAATVTTVPDPDIPDDITFEWAFRKWIVALVAGLFDPDKVNEEILVLVGKQGTYKTTWLGRLLPPELRSYFRIKTDSRHFDKDDKLSLAEFALICLEELEVLRPSELNQLKALTTDKTINERPAYARYKEERLHIASFCGTSNNIQFLNDPSGERRWLPFEIERIDNPHSHTLPYEGMYAQALHLWREGFPYWFEGEENDRLNRHNNRFEVPDLLYDLIHTHYRVPIPGEPAVFLTTADIVAHISYALKTPPALHHIGRIMKEAGYTAVRHAGRRGYLVIRLDSEHIEAARRMAGRG